MLVYNNKEVNRRSHGLCSNERSEQGAGKIKESLEVVLLFYDTIDTEDRVVINFKHTSQIR